MALALVAAMLPLPGSLALAAGPGPAANDARTQVVDGVRLDAAHQLAALGEIRAAQRGAVCEPQREPVARLTDRVRARFSHGAAQDHADQRLDIGRGRDRRRPPRHSRHRLAALYVDRARLAGHVEKVSAHLRARAAPGLIEEDPIAPHGG
jgi:hypothetical protein